MTKSPFSLYVDHGLDLDAGGEQNGERLDGGKNEPIPKDSRSGHVIGVVFIIFYISTIMVAPAPEDDTCIVLPIVGDGDVPGRVMLPADLGFTVRLNDGFLAAQNGFRQRERRDFDVLLHDNRQLCASTRECKHPLRIRLSFQRHCSIPPR